jgi:hypothetical protein
MPGRIHPSSTQNRDSRWLSSEHWPRLGHGVVAKYCSGPYYADHVTPLGKDRMKRIICHLVTSVFALTYTFAVALLVTIYRFSRSAGDQFTTKEGITTWEKQ